ncbi:hypothetical protein F5B22DRAFT_649254 [Xylaria bambusicola]|uniref:uncharacterized protein n=1 Tax=Xylaria bambusicola TaxID=326684 RepID=UPI0020085166|nr:uncharacterized protein F5B22DRAFT_649254 [Xylaria bambusicola]KAI0509205.1 hypothetical protein F5B22DRAFT_649254 [Xylaria bambusicola]
MNPKIGSYRGGSKQDNEQLSFDGVRISGDAPVVVGFLGRLKTKGVLNHDVTVDLNFGATPNPPAPKRAFSEDGMQANVSEHKRQKREPIDPDACGNCGETNHKAAFCITTGRSGWVECCPKCDSTLHLYEHCVQRRKKEDFIFLVYNRQNKPPIKSSLKLGNVIKKELVRPHTTFRESDRIALPYSSRFARQEARQNPPATYTYAYAGNPVREAALRTSQPTRDGITLANAVNDSSFALQAWSRAEETFDPRRDAPMPNVLYGQSEKSPKHPRVRSKISKNAEEESGRRATLDFPLELSRYHFCAKYTQSPIYVAIVAKETILRMTAESRFLNVARSTTWPTRVFLDGHKLG